MLESSDPPGPGSDPGHRKKPPVLRGLLFGSARNASDAGVFGLASHGIGRIKPAMHVAHQS